MGRKNKEIVGANEIKWGIISVGDVVSGVGQDGRRRSTCEVAWIGVNGVARRMGG